MGVGKAPTLTADVCNLLRWTPHSTRQEVAVMKRSNLLRRSAAVLSSALVVQAGGLPCFAAVARADDAPRVVILPLVAGKGSPANEGGRTRTKWAWIPRRDVRYLH